MRTKLLLLLFILSFNVAMGQSATTASYVVSTDTTSSLFSMTGSRELVGFDINNSSSFVESTIFDFWFMGVLYNKFTVNSNGLIQLGTTAINAIQTADGFPHSNYGGVMLAAFAGDLSTSMTGKIHSVVNGNAPYRRCIIEFLNMGLGNSSVNVDGTFQVILYETTGVIQYIYGGMKIGNPAGVSDVQSVVIGFSNDSLDNQVLTLDHTSFAVNRTAIPTKKSYTTAGLITSLNSAVDGARRSITFTAPILNSPIAPQVFAITSSTVNLSWDQSLVIGEQGFVIYKSEDGGVNYDFVLQTAADATFATISNLLASSTYIFKIYSVSEGALSTPISITCTTKESTVTTTNTLLLTVFTPLIWSTLGPSWSLGHLPTSGEDAVINFNSSSIGDEVGTLIFDADAALKSLTINNISTSTDVKVVNITGYGKLSVAGDITLTCSGGNKFNRCSFSAQNKTIINGNVVLGRANALQDATEGQCTIGSYQSSREQLYIIRGNMIFNKRSYTTDEHSNFTFDKAGTQYLYNYTTPQPYPYTEGVGDTLQAVLFEKLVIGSTNASTLIFAGTGHDCYMELHSREGVTIGLNSTLDLAQNFSINSLGGASYFKMLAGAKLKLGGDQTISPNGIIYGVAGSNFPGSFSPYLFDPTSTIEYNGPNTVTQTIYNGVNYGNLVATNGSGIGRAQKNTTGPIVVNTSFNINGLADVTLGTLNDSTKTVISAGPLNVMATGGLYCNANVVSGTGAFTMGNESYLGMGHVQGIANTGSATGNIQMAANRNYNSTSNYIYNGLLPQITGLGLPTTVNNLTIDNPSTVTIASNQIINGINLLKQGSFDIARTKITINGATGILNSTGGKMKANLGILEMKGTATVAQKLAGSWFVNRNISTLINANTTGITVDATVGDTLLVSSALMYGAVAGSVITTNDNLTLLSRDTATANFGEVKDGNSIVGKVNIERYLSAKKSWRLLAAPIANATSPFVAAAWRENGSMASTGYGTRITGPASFIGMDEYTVRASMKYYNVVTNNYVDVSNTNSTKIANSAGYYIFVRGDKDVALTGAAGATILRMKGDILTGPQLMTVPAGKFLAFGNPYPSRIAIELLSKTKISNAVTVWNPFSEGMYSVGAFETYIWDGANYTKPGGAIRNYIESGEAVFIQSNSDTAGSITILEAAKVNGSSMHSKMASNTTVTTAPTLKINMFTKNADGSTFLADGVWLNFSNGYVNEIDNEDVRKVSNATDNLSIKNGATLLVVERRSALQLSDTIKLNISNTRINPYYFKIDPLALDCPNLIAFFRDKFLNTETIISLTQASTIPFEITADVASKEVDRFMIYFKPAPMRFAKITAERSKQNTVNVAWNVVYENNINYFTIEQSEDGITFKTLGTQMPTSNNYTNVSYFFADVLASIKSNWYRVKATPKVGTVQYSDIVKVTPVEAPVNMDMTIYPNLVTEGNINFFFTNKPVGNYQLQISNKMGQVIHTETLSIQNRKVQKTVKIAYIASGAYQALIVDAMGKKTTIAFIVQ